MINYSLNTIPATPGTRKQDVTSWKTYAVAQYGEKMDISAFSKHITSHGCVYSRADVQAILTMAVDCLREQMLEGRKVTLGDLGSFFVTLESEGSETAEKFTSQNIKAVNVRWQPGTLFENLRDEATFKLVPSREGQAKALADIKGSSDDDTPGGGALPGLD